MLVRNAMFRRVEWAARRRTAELTESSSWSEEEWSEALDDYFADHDTIDTGPDARGPRMLLLEKRPTSWEVQQILGDPAGDHDWRITATVDLTSSDEEGELVIDVSGLHRL